MLAIRRIPTICQYLSTISVYSSRLKSRKSGDDEGTGNVERQSGNPPGGPLKNRKTANSSSKPEQRSASQREPLSNRDDLRSSEDLLRKLNVSSANRRKPSNQDRERSPSGDALNLAKPSDVTAKKQRREGEQSGQKQKKPRPHVILDTDSTEVKTLTRQVADSLTPSNAPTEGINIEQELLDVLRGHRVVSKTARRTEKRPTLSQETPSEKPVQSKARSEDNANVERNNEAFSSLLRDIKLKPARSTSDSSLERDSFRDEEPMARSRLGDARDTRRPMRDAKRRQEFIKPQQLWSGEALGIFSKEDSKDVLLQTSPMWDKFEEDEIKRISSITPRNAFEEMIQWTHEGILWKFPIDNEQDIGPEADVPFYEHVLLERHLQEFPNTPLIRQFMEMVCVGLGRNPYWTVEQKVDHINWFRTFFNEKMHVFNETVHTGTTKATAAAATKPVSTYKAKPAPPPPAPKAVPVVAPPVAKAPAAGKK